MGHGGERATACWTAAVITLSSAIAATACCKSATPAPERCVVTLPPLARVPRLYRQANWRRQSLPPFQAPLCTQEQPRAIEDECESVDDLKALLGNGVACGPAGPAVQHVCPTLSERVKETQPTVQDKPCGDAACPNKQIEVREASGSLTRILFYDDPACHAAAPDPKCSAAAHACYYRVLAVTAELAAPES